MILRPVAYSMEIVLIAAIAANRVIGAANTIPWRIPGEQARFKMVTWGFPLIMGRKTHESIGRALPGRHNIVVSRNRRYQAPDCTVVFSLEQALDLCTAVRRVFLIGGQEIFRQGLPLARTLILSELDAPCSGDVFFPEFSKTEFLLHDSERVDGPIPYTINTYRRAHAASHGL